MATSKEYLNYILGQLSSLDDITYRPMMGEYIIYYRRKIAAYLCDNRFLVKPVSAAVSLMPGADAEAPYEGAKLMLVVDNTDDKKFLEKLFNAMYAELLPPKHKKR